MLIIPDFLKTTNELIFKYLNISIQSVSLEIESSDYNACQLQLNDKKALFRTAKTTPTKTGQFVTLWKRTTEGPIAPFDENDEIDLVIVNTETETQFGQFVFPKSILIAKGVFSTNLKEGKRAFRVYPSWDVPTSKQALKTQEWQRDYFVDVTDEKSILTKLKELYF